MKKSILGIAVACLAMAGCTKTQVVDVAQDRAIGFSPFVGKPTKAVTEVTTSTIGTGFYVFGFHGKSTGNLTEQAFNNEISTTEYYWEADEIYAFGAYADGVNGKIDNVSFDPSTRKLTFTGYTPDDSKDLVAAVTEEITANDYMGISKKVDLSFKHLLSQVKLTFTTDAAEVYNMKITDVVINDAVSKANCEYDANNIIWDNESATNGYIYNELLNSGVISSEVPSEQVKLVIPQSGTGDLKVTFKATLSNPSYSGTAEFEATLGHNISDSGLTANTWTPGYRYNYIANVPLEKVIDNPEGKVKIEFTPTVEDWKDAEDDINTTPTTPAIP